MKVLSADSQYDLACACGTGRDCKYCPLKVERHPEYYPVRINSSDKNTLLRVPGIGPDTADRILKTQQDRGITRLEDLGLRGKRLEKVKGYVVVE